MTEAEQMRILATRIDGARLGLADLLAPVADRHQPQVWYSKSADSSRLRLRLGHQRRLEGVHQALVAASSRLREAATVLDLKAALDAASGGD